MRFIRSDVGYCTCEWIIASNHKYDDKSLDPCYHTHRNRRAASEKAARLLKKEITAMLFAKRYQEHSISISSACEEYYSQVSFAMEFGNGVRSGIHLW